MRANTALIFAAALVSQVAATIYVTNPVASTTCTAGGNCTLAWNDDGTAPALATIGPCQIDLAIGDVTSQYPLMNISPSLDVSQNAQISFTPDATIGGDSNDYFIKFTSISYMDPTNAQFHYTSFSAKFTLTGMTGTFNSTVSAAIAGASVVPAAGASSAAAVATPAAAATTTPAAMATVKASATSSAAAKATTSAKATSGAANVSSSMTIVSLVSLVMGAAFMSL